MRTTTFTLTATVALLVAGAVVAPAAVAGPLTAPAASDAAASGAYTAVTPARILDTRDGTGGLKAPLTHGVARTVQVSGRAGVPVTGASSVVLNVTVTNPTTGGYLSVFPGGGSPTTSNLNFVAGQTVANLVSVQLPTSGTVTLYYSGGAGTTDVVADVNGWFAGGGTPTADGAFVPVAPKRLLDTRATSPVSPSADRVLVVRGPNGVPTKAGAVILNVTVTDTTTAGFVTVYPGGARPTASNLNYVAGQTVPNLVAIPLADNGTVSLGVGGSNAAADLVVDVFGYYVGSAPSQSGMFGALAPARVLDTRSGVGAPTARVAGQATLPLQLSGRGGVPTTGVSAVVVNVTAVNPQTAGYFTVYGPGDRPLASNLNFGAGTVVPNLVIVPVAGNGTISIFNGGGGATDVVADVTGYVRDGSLAVPSASVSRYVNDLQASQSNVQLAAAMEVDGRQDAAATPGTGPRLTILEFGAQTNKAGGNGVSRGVRLPASDTRLTYAQVQAAAQGYLDGVEDTAPSANLTVALGTSSAGYLGATYAATDKGGDWATLVTAVAGYAEQQDYGITVVGANDIEANFSATAAENRTWIARYRAGANPPALINNGAAANCPGTFGVVNQSCGAVYVEESDPGRPVYNTWTQADYVSFSTGAGVTIAPQIYYGVQAVQWENILLSGGGSSIRLSGVLTQVAACGQVDEDCDSLTPTQAWSAMTQALDASPATAALVVPAVTDIRYP